MSMLDALLLSVQRQLFTTHRLLCLEAVSDAVCDAVHIPLHSLHLTLHSLHSSFHCSKMASHSSKQAAVLRSLSADSHLRWSLHAAGMQCKIMHLNLVVLALLLLPRAEDGDGMLCPRVSASHPSCPAKGMVAVGCNKQHTA